MSAREEFGDFPGAGGQGINGAGPGRSLRNSLLGWVGIGTAVLIGLFIARLISLNPLVAILLVAALAAIIVASNPWRGAIMLLLASQFNGFRFDYGAFTLRPDQVVFLVAFVVVLAYFAMGRFRLYKTVLDLPIIAYLLVGLAASFLNSPDAAYSYQGLMLQTVYASMYILTVNILLNYREKIDDTVRAFLYIAIIHSLYALAAFAAFQGGVKIGGISSAHYGSLGLPSTSGFFQEANLFGAFIALAAVIMVVHLVTSGGTGLLSRRALVAGVVILLTVTATSMTRSVWVGMLLILMALPLYSRPRRNVVNPKALAVIIVLVVSLGLVVMPVLNYAFSITSGKEDALYARMADLVNFGSGSGAGRLDVQEIAFERWQERPFIGHGVLSLEGSEGEYSRGWFYSSFVQSLFDTGMIGAALMILIHIVPMFYAFYAAYLSRSATRRATLVGFGLGAFVMAIASQASSFFWIGFPWIYLGILVACARATIDEERERLKNDSIILSSG